MTNFIPYGRQDIRQEDIDKVVSVLKSDFLTQGPQVPFFEKKVSQFVGAPYAVAFNSATSALHAACAALGLAKGDILWTSPITFVASANCARYLGSEVDFVDINLRTGNICIDSYRKKLIIAEKERRLPKVFIPVHFAGMSCDMEEIFHLSKSYGVKIVEDASHSIGGIYKENLIGNCKFSDITIFSFHPVKIITSGEGGMALTKDKILNQKLIMFRSHGITRNNDDFENKSEGSWYYEQQSLGYNYRITDLQAALGASQLERIDEYVKRRNYLAERYREALKDLNLQMLDTDVNCYSSYHLFLIKVDKKIRKYIFEKMRSLGIGVNVHYIPVHLHPYYRKLGFNKGDFTSAEIFYSEIISIPIYPKMKISEQDKVISILRNELS